MLKNNKRGLSTIIVTVLLIGLTIVAVGIVWAVVNNTLKKGAENVDVGTKCLGIDVRATSVVCSGTPATCIVRLERTGSRDDAISGVKLVFENTTGSRSPTPSDYAGNIAQLENPTTPAYTPGITAPDKIETTVYFTGTSGNTQYCPQPNIFTF